MVTTIETLHKEISNLRKDMKYIKNIISENHELSESAKKALQTARKTPESEYIDL